jgi:hypothetical protein
MASPQPARQHVGVQIKNKGGFVGALVGGILPLAAPVSTPRREQRCRPTPISYVDGQQANGVVRGLD